MPSNTVPAGGAIYARLAKNSTTDYDTGWYGPYTFNVKDYGAVGNGSTSDYTAISNAIGAACAATLASNGFTNACVYFPPGAYLIDAQLSLTSPFAGNIVFRGDGWQESQLIFTGTGNGLYCDLSGSSSYVFLNSVEICDLALLANANNAASATALTITYGTSSGTGDETNPGSAVRRVYIGTIVNGSYSQANSNAGWTNGIVCTACHALDIDSVCLMPGAAGTGVGLKLNSCINGAIRDLYGGGWAYAITLNNAGGGLEDCQGLFFIGIRFVGAKELLHGYGSSGLYPNGFAGITIDNWMIDDGYSGGTYTAGITLEYCAGASILGGYAVFYDLSTAAIKTVNSKSIMIDGNTILIVSSNPGILVASSSTDVTITGNTSVSAGNGIEIDSGCARTTVVANNCHGSGTPISDSGTSTINANNQT